MEHSALTSSSALTPSFRLDHLSDAELLASTRAQVGRSNQVLAALLAHLSEVEARGIHRTRACSSLYTYCVYELRMSEDSALRRSHAARLVRQYPAALESIAAGELHLTGLLALGPHLTETNHREVLARAKHRTKKEIADLVRMLDPLPDAPARIEALGPVHPPRMAKTWANWLGSFAPPVRELSPGERPKDWIPDEPSGAKDLDAQVTGAEQPSADEVQEEGRAGAEEPEPPALVVEQSFRYRVEFTASAEYIELLEQARDLLAPAVPRRAIADVHLRAMRAFVAELRKKKFALTDKPRASTAGAANPRSRHIPAAVRRAVAERDAGRCAYVADDGQRCRETSGLELHHEEAFARGGQATVDNVWLRCRAHNALAAEADFGRDFIARKMGTEVWVT